MTDPERRAEELASRWFDLGSRYEQCEHLRNALLAFVRAEVKRELVEIEDWLAADCAPWNHPSLSVTGLYSVVLNEIARRRASLKA